MLLVFKRYNQKNYMSSTVVICNHDSSTDCFHKVTRWSPVDTARTFPVIDQLTLQTGASNSFNNVGSHGPSIVVCFQIKTFLENEIKISMFYFLHCNQ